MGVRLKRRTFLKQAGFVLAAAAFTDTLKAGGPLFSNNVMQVNIGRKRKPNIVYIYADDLGIGDLSCYGQQKFTTPHIDALAAEGMKFTQHYSGSTVCAPSRCALMTGLHTGHCYIRGNKGVSGYDWPIRDSDFTFAEMFKQAGYTTGCFGKWGLGGPETEGHPNNQGFDEFFGYLGQGKAHRYYPDFLWKNEQQVTLDQPGTYSHDLIADEALAFINDNKDKPFFLYVPYTIPHAELLVPEDETLAYFRSLGWPETPFEGGHYGAQPTPHAAFAAMVTRMDKDVGRIMALLKELKLDNDTLVLFTSDNGTHSEGGHDPVFFDSNGIYRGKKRDLYEGGIRTPLIARWPGRIAAGTTCGHLSAQWDMMPTFAELIEADFPSGLDGISFAPALFGKPADQHEYLYWEFHEQNGKQAVRKGNWKGVRLNMQNGPDPPVELYDLENDPSETTDVAADNPTIAAELKTLMIQAHTPSDLWKFHGE